MAGTFLIGERPARAGVYYRRERVGVTVEGAINGVVAAIIGDCTWGALNKVTTVDQTDLNNLSDIFGIGNGVTAVKEALMGGAKQVKVVRIGDATGKVGSVTLKATGENGVAAVKVSARHVGARPFAVTVRTNPATLDRELIFYEDTDIFQKVTFAAGGDEAAALVAALSTNRDFIGEKLAAGVLADVTQSALTGGANPGVSNENYVKGTEILERHLWNVVIADTDSAAVRAVLNEFVKQSYETGHLGLTCLSGTSSETFDARLDYSISCNDEKIVYVLGGWVGNDGAVYDGWRAAARIGGMIAASETNTSLTHAVIANALELTENFTNGELIQAVQAGCLALSLNSDNQVIIDNAVTTLITEGTNLDLGWKKIRRTKTRFELMDRINRTVERLVGKVNNDIDGRATVMAAAQGIINEMVAEHKLVAGSRITEDAAHPPVADYAWFVLEIRDYDSLEKILETFRFSYGQTFEE